MSAAPTTTLWALHGFTQHGALLEEQLAPLVAELPSTIAVEYPDAPHTCTPQSVARMAGWLGAALPPPPHRCWWDADDEGRVYRGWQNTRAWAERCLPASQPFGLLGFSQGAILAATLSALATRGELPAPRFVVLVAGRPPRADAVRALFDRPIPYPSLHVWGKRDALTGPHTEALAAHFEEGAREVVVWPGPHVVPTRGPAAAKILEFVRRHA